MERVLRSYPKIYLACHTRHLREDGSGQRLSPRLASLLDHLAGENRLSISELARHLDVTESTISLHIDKLQRLGYARRMRDPHDARRVGVALTAKGERVRLQNSVLDPELVRKMLSLLQPGEAESATRGLELLAAAAERLMERRQVRRTRRAR